MSNKHPFMTVNDSDLNYRYYFGLLFNRLCNMIHWSGLPPSIDVQYLNQLIYLTGSATFFKENDTLYISNCVSGGELNEYYLPRFMILANPVLGSKTLEINKDCAVVWTSTTDKLYSGSILNMHGLCPTYGLIDKTAHLLAECLTSMNVAQINARASYLVTAPTSTAKTSAELALKAIYGGKPFIVANENLVGNIQALPLSSNNAVTALRDLRELHQFYLSQFYHAIGVNSTLNFKRERLISDEVKADSEPLVINIKDMIDSIKEGVKNVNRLFNTNITAELSKEWQYIEDSTHEV